MQTIMVELPQWLYYIMAINVAISGATLACAIIFHFDK